MEQIYYIIAFDSTHHAISTEKVLKEANKEIMMIPTPREITSSCGLSLRLKKEDIPFAKENLIEKSIAYHGIFRIKSSQGKKEVEKI